MKVRIFGCTFSFSFWFFAVTTAAVLLDRSGTMFAGTAAALLHECGHIAVMAAQKGCGISRVELKPLGVCIAMRGVPSQAGRMVISLAGAFANFSAAAVCAAVYFCFGARMAETLLTANVCLALLNLLPVEPLDGGVTLRCMLEELCRPEHTDRVMNVCAAASVGLLTCAGAFILFRLRGSFSLLLMGMWMAGVVLEKQLG